MDILFLVSSSARRGSNPRPQPWQGCALPTEPLAHLLNTSDIILKMYDKLRPNRSTKLELVMMAQELLEKYNARNCAKLVMEAAEVYEKRGILLGVISSLE